MSSMCDRVAAGSFHFKDDDTLTERHSAGVTYKCGAFEDRCDDPFDQLAKAATGNIEAQRLLADEALSRVIEDCGGDPLTTLSEGLIFARMAASHGDGNDHGRAIVILSLASLFCCEEVATDLAAEAIARLEILADSGDEASAALLATNADKETAETMRLAKEFRTRILQRAGGTRNSNAGMPPPPPGHVMDGR